MYHWQLFLQVKWENRLMRDCGKTCKVTVDGMDCPVLEPKPFSTHWYSHKFKKAGLRYKLGICIQTGWNVWANGPYPCGPWPNIKIFWHKLQQMLPPGEKVEADLGYHGESNYIQMPWSAVSLANYRAGNQACAHHETINGQIKSFNCLSICFCHTLDKHSTFFGAIVALVQLSIMMGEQPWQVRY